MSATAGVPIDMTEYIARTAVTNGSFIATSGSGALTNKDWCAIVIINDTVLSSVTCGGMTNSSSLHTITLPAGLVIFGNFTGITVTSGVVQGIERRNG